jgi:hypothetical protein
MRRGPSKQPPFENRWTSGQKAWRWHQELEALGVENTRLCLVLHDEPQNVAFPDAEIPAGFVRAWLRYHDRKAHRAMAGWIAALAVCGATMAAAAAWLAVRLTG